ncbi:MAG TPA: hypothetical protein PL077_09515 [Treponemataceae bacterium]|nr:hypothetical protein [Treponemataceae bacterium]
MSDLLVGEILVLLLSVPVLLRPFFRRLQRIEGIPLLPPLSLALAVSLIFACGFQLSFVPVLAFSVFLNLLNLPRFARFCFRLPTDWYGIGSYIAAVLLLLLLVPVSYGAAYFAPVAEAVPDSDISHAESREQFYPGSWRTVSEWKPDPQLYPRSRGLVLLQGDFFTEGSRNTLAASLAGMGFRVIEPRFSSASDFISPLFNASGIRKILFYSAALLRNDALLPDEAGDALQRSVGRRFDTALAMKADDEPLYVVAEGDAVSVVVKTWEAGPGICDGIAVLSDSLPAFDIRSGSMPSVYSSAPAVFFHDGGKEIPCELVFDDPLGAVILGYPREKDRSAAVLLARRIGSWFDMRRAYAAAGDR